MNRYEEYKKVNLIWLKEIPSHWEIMPISHVFEERRERNNNGNNQFILSVMKNIGVIPYTDKGNVGNKASENIENYKVVYPNDLVLNSMNMMIGSLGKSNYKGVLSQVYYVLKLMNSSKYNIDYLNYLFKNKVFHESFRVLGKGILDHRLRVPIQLLKYEKILIPPINEQEQIANYLDWKISEIDRLIKIEKEKIKELNHIMQFIIDSRYKALNIQDTISTGTKIKYLAKPITKRTSESRRYIALENVISKKGVLNVSYDELDFNNDGISVEKDMVIFGKLRPYLAKTIVVENRAVCSSEFLVLKPDNLLPLYLKYLMLSSKFIDLVDSSTYGTKMPRANSDFILNLRIVVPGLSEQKENVEKILKNEGKINKSIELILRKMKSMEDLKQSLISEVVTGKIDVRNVVIPEYEKVTVLDDEVEEFDEKEGIEDGN
ncbi:restriction endonuclease subunit S [Mesomycoplasma ovipneumoniae]|uniref:restriction endonuclease subunit S n=1 Tax=Mesomycoplasma ovipneumoniae TaxID=29562 RepID=UPI0029643EDA|nr:restriction endonuclease subunit S [Mesomycoplasma ovipneumoniae]MDW2907958.1 restriction endonuclease subunit S [Mesomycoplasma ovipneumoniae]